MPQTITINPFKIIQESLSWDEVEKIPHREPIKASRPIAEITNTFKTELSKLDSQQNSAINIEFVIPENYKKAFESCSSRQLLGYIKRIQGTIEKKYEQLSKEIDAIEMVKAKIKSRKKTIEQKYKKLSKQIDAIEIEKEKLMVEIIELKHMSTEDLDKYFNDTSKSSIPNTSTREPLNKRSKSETYPTLEALKNKLLSRNMELAGFEDELARCEDELARCEDELARCEDELASWEQKKLFFEALNDNLIQFQEYLETSKNPDMKLTYSDIVKYNDFFSKTPNDQWIDQPSLSLIRTHDHELRLNALIDTLKTHSKDSSLNPRKEETIDQAGKTYTTLTQKEEEAAYLENCHTYITSTPESYIMVSQWLDQFDEFKLNNRYDKFNDHLKRNKINLESYISTLDKHPDSIGSLSTTEIRERLAKYSNETIEIKKTYDTEKEEYDTVMAAIKAGEIFPSPSAKQIELMTQEHIASIQESFVQISTMQENFKSEWAAYEECLKDELSQLKEKTQRLKADIVALQSTCSLNELNQAALYDELTSLLVHHSNLYSTLETTLEKNPLALRDEKIISIKPPTKTLGEIDGIIALHRGDSPTSVMEVGSPRIGTGNGKSLSFFPKDPSEVQTHANSNRLILIEP